MRSLLLLLLLLAACGKAPGGPGPRQIRLVGATAALPFTADAAERYLLSRGDAVAPLAQADGSGAGIARFCGGTGARHPDIVATTRAMTTAESTDCAAHGIAHVAAVPFGWSALVLVTRPDTPALAITRTALAAALAGGATWHQVDPRLPPLRIDLRGPAPRAALADGLFDLLAPGAAPRSDGAYRGYGADADLVVQTVAETPGAIGLVPYGYAVAHRDQVRMLALDGIAPDAATIASARYPLRAPLILHVKTDEVADTPGLRPLLGLFAASLAPAGRFAALGLVPLADAERAAAMQHVASL